TMGAKKLKAIVVKVDKKIRPVPADPVALDSLAKRVSELKIKNWEEYAHDEAFSIGRPAACYGCIDGCTRKKYTGENNLKYKVLCQAAVVYIEQVSKYYTKSSDIYLLATRLCDSYGLDTMVMQPLIRWLSQCYDKGILSDTETGLPLSKIGSAEFIETLVKQIALREGFGKILARGLVKASEYVGRGSMRLLNSKIASKVGELQDYDPRVMLVNALHIATEPRRPIGLLHGTSYPYIKWLNWNDGYADAGLTTDILRGIAETYWGSIEALDFSTYEGKALAAKKIQDYSYTKECMTLCDMIWPIYLIHLRDSTLKPGTLESRILTAITGRRIDEAEFFEIGERIFNLQRAILINQGWEGIEDDILMPYLFDEPIKTVFFSAECMVPGKNGQMTSRKGAVVDKSEFEKMKNEFYSLRGWDEASGLQLKSGMNKLGLDDIAENLEKRSLVK
ncbi:aldehyde ferredoxin oxidoreductase C-terminal domain-containing protein, partial [Thermodesulfobacteriota bacterium]